MVAMQAKIFFARLCIYIGSSLLTASVILKFRKPDRCALVACPLLCSLTRFFMCLVGYCPWFKGTFNVCGLAGGG